MSTPMPPPGPAGGPPYGPPYGWPPPPPVKKHTVRTVLLSILGAVVAVIVIVAVVDAVAGVERDSGGSSDVDRGVGARDASADVTISSCAADTMGFMNGKLSITNHSGGRSDYYIEVVFLDAAGTNIGSGVATVMSVEGGQSATTDLFGTFTGKLARCKLTEVQRTASN